jgi:hypothetical protein
VAATEEAVLPGLLLVGGLVSHRLVSRFGVAGEEAVFPGRLLIDRLALRGRLGGRIGVAREETHDVWLL